MLSLTHILFMHYVRAVPFGAGTGGVTDPEGVVLHYGRVTDLEEVVLHYGEQRLRLGAGAGDAK